ncbi:MAG TPA: glycosyltransferase family 87 protein [Verrucomicrobiae bacterium]|nr:glycosyltransferase family 87 protein [Verrucomicrobiae bacterium]
MKNAGQAWVLDALAAGLALFGVVHVARVLPSRAISNDFAHYYISSRLLLTGADVYSTPMKPEYERWGFHYAVEIPRATNPPFLVGIFAPFAALPPRAAFWAWVSLEILSLGCLLALTWWLAAARLSARARRLVCAGIIASAPVYWHFVFSQCQLLIGAIILIAYSGLRNGRPAGACLAITTATWLKLFPAVLIPWFLWRSSRDWTTRAKCAAVTLAWSAGLVAASGWDNWKQFWAYGMKVVEEWIKWQRHFDFTVPSFVKNVAWYLHGFNLEWAELDEWVRVGAIVGAVFIALMYGLVWWSARGRKDPDLESEFCLLSIAMLAGNAQGWGHYYVMLAFPFAVAVARVAQRPMPGRIALLVLSLAMLNVMGDWRISWLEFTVSYIPLYGLLLLGAFFVNEALNPEPQTASSTMSALPPS